MNDIRDLFPGRMRERTFQLKARRDAGKLYDDPTPYDQADPFSEFQHPAAKPVRPEPKPRPKPAPAPEQPEPAPSKADLSVEQQLSGLTVDDILNELR